MQKELGESKFAYKKGKKKKNHGKQVSLEIERAAIRDNVAWKRFIERCGRRSGITREGKTNATFLPRPIPRIEGAIFRVFYHSPLCRQARHRDTKSTRWSHPISRRFLLRFFMAVYFSDKDVIFLDDRSLLAEKSRQVWDRPASYDAPFVLAIFYVSRKERNN